MDSSYVFNHYNGPMLFPLVMPDDVNASEFDIVADSEVIGFTIPGTTVLNLTSTPIKYTVQSLRGRQGKVYKMTAIFYIILLTFNLSIVMCRFFLILCVSRGISMLLK